MRLLTLDPSVNNVGWATCFFNAETKEDAWRWGTFKLDGSNLEMRMMDLVQQISNEVGPFHLLCTEKPAFFNNERGKVAASMNYTIDLAAISYFVAGWHHMSHREHYAITATQWKGAVTKVITARRFFKRFPGVDAATLSEHAIDAIMLGCYCIRSYLTKRKDLNPEHLLTLI